MCNLRWMFTVSLLFITIKGHFCLKNVRVIVPEAVERGSRVELKCLYNLEDQDLYSVKWYRDDQEFCRYLPNENLPLKIFRVPGIEVDRNGSDAERLTIEAVSETASGWYTCEVSTDAPLFHTALVQANMYVVVLPTEGPSMYGLQRQYRVGDTLRVDCASFDSLPPANLTFFINNERALSEHVLQRVDGKIGGLMSAYSTLQFTVQNHHFIQGKMRIRCTAMIYSIYLKAYEKSAQEETVGTTTSTLAKVNDSAEYSINQLAPTSEQSHS